LLTHGIGAGISQERFALLVIGSYALRTLLLSALGIYGVLSYSVRRRQREMSVRLALGADTRAIMTMVLSDSAGLIVLGAVLGGSGALLATRALTSLLFEVTATDPIVFAIAGAAIVAVSLGAQLDPREDRDEGDPIDALKSDA
jgi:putative ABC transport system permease protein